MYLFCYLWCRFVIHYILTFICFFFQIFFFGWEGVAISFDRIPRICSAIALCKWLKYVPQGQYSNLRIGHLIFSYFLFSYTRTVQNAHMRWAIEYCKLEYCPGVMTIDAPSLGAVFHELSKWFYDFSEKICVRFFHKKIPSKIVTKIVFQTHYSRLTETARLLRNVRNVFSRRSNTRVNMELELSREYHTKTNPVNFDKEMYNNDLKRYTRIHINIT